MPNNPTATSAETFAAAFKNLDAAPPFAEATVRFADGSALYFCHRVGERWAKVLPKEEGGDEGEAGRMLKAIAMFRLNRKHLDITFADGSHWERKP